MRRDLDLARDNPTAEEEADGPTDGARLASDERVWRRAARAIADSVGGMTLDAAEGVA